MPGTDRQAALEAAIEALADGAAAPEVDRTAILGFSSFLLRRSDKKCNDKMMDHKIIPSIQGTCCLDFAPYLLTTRPRPALSSRSPNQSLIRALGDRLAKLQAGLLTDRSKRWV